MWGLNTVDSVITLNLLFFFPIVLIFAYIINKLREIGDRLESIEKSMVKLDTENALVMFLSEFKKDMKRL